MRYRMEEPAGAIDVRFMAMLISDAFCSRKISRKQFEELRRSFEVEKGDFTLRKDLRTWSGFLWRNQNDEWEPMCASYYPLVFDKRIDMLHNGVAVTPLYRISYEYSFRNQKEDFTSELTEAFSPNLLRLCAAIAEYPIAKLDPEGIEAFNKLARQAEPREKKEIVDFFGRFWNIYE